MEPPPVVEDVNITDVPLQIDDKEAETDMVGEVPEFTLIEIGEAVAVETEGQAAEEVITTVTASPFARVVVVNVDEFVPALVPFTFH